jgi:acetyl esterase/lipase
MWAGNGRMSESVSVRPGVVPLWPDGSSQNLRNPMERPRLEMYLPSGEQAQALAAVIVCPGGGYRFRAPHEAAPVAQLLAAHGLAAIVCHYRVAPQRYPAPMADVARAVRKVRENAAAWGLDPARIALLGFSAGGHAAVTVATRPDLYRDPQDDLVDRYSARPNRLILAYPVVSMVEEAHEACLLNLFGRDPGAELREAVSAERWVDRETPPTFLFHTADDPGVAAGHSLRYAAACRARGVAVELHLFAHGPHGVGLAQDDPALAMWPRLLLNWLSDWLPDGARRRET